MVSPKAICVNWNVLRSRFASRKSLIVTCWAGAVAVGSFSNWISYGSVVPAATKFCGPNPAGPIMAFGSAAVTLGDAIMGAFGSVEIVGIGHGVMGGPY